MQESVYICNVNPGVSSMTVPSQLQAAVLRRLCTALRVATLRILVKRLSSVLLAMSNARNHHGNCHKFRTSASLYIEVVLPRHSSRFPPSQGLALFVCLLCCKPSLLSHCHTSIPFLALYLVTCSLLTPKVGCCQLTVRLWAVCSTDGPMAKLTRKEVR